jgi:tetratricopeptide (TPR) repeat protein
LGAVYIFTNRAAQGIAECEQALALDRNLADAHAAVGLAKFLMGRAAETERHILEALRLSPRDIFANWWMHCLGRAKIQLEADAEAVDWLRRSIEARLDRCVFQRRQARFSKTSRVGTKKAHPKCAYEAMQLLLA